MKPVSIKFDLYCRWRETPPCYRIYVDDELLVERSYFWRIQDAFVRELISVNLESGHHEIKLQNLHPELGVFRMKDIEINGVKTTNLDFIVP